MATIFDRLREPEPDQNFNPPQNVASLPAASAFFQRIKSHGDRWEAGVMRDSDGGLVRTQYGWVYDPKARYLLDPDTQKWIPAPAYMLPPRLGESPAELLYAQAALQEFRQKQEEVLPLELVVVPVEKIEGTPIPSSCCSSAFHWVTSKVYSLFTSAQKSKAV